MIDFPGPGIKNNYLNWLHTLISFSQSNVKQFYLLWSSSTWFCQENHSTSSNSKINFRSLESPTVIYLFNLWLGHILITDTWLWKSMTFSKHESVVLPSRLKKKKSNLWLLTTNINKNHPNTFMGILKSLYSAKQLEESIKLGVEDFSTGKNSLIYFSLITESRSIKINYNFNLLMFMAKHKGS